MTMLIRPMDYKKMKKSLKRLTEFTTMWYGYRCDHDKYDPDSSLRKDVKDAELCPVCEAWAVIDEIKRSIESAEEEGYLQ